MKIINNKLSCILWKIINKSWKQLHHYHMRDLNFVCSRWPWAHTHTHTHTAAMSQGSQPGSIKPEPEVTWGQTGHMYMHVSLKAECPEKKLHDSFPGEWIHSIEALATIQESETSPEMWNLVNARNRLIGETLSLWETCSVWLVNRELQRLCPCAPPSHIHNNA